jgi:hypothetical protein
MSRFALMMEAVRTSETLVNFYQTTRCYNPEDSNLLKDIGCEAVDWVHLAQDRNQCWIRVATELKLFRKRWGASD